MPSAHSEYSGRASQFFQAGRGRLPSPPWHIDAEPPNPGNGRADHRSSVLRLGDMAHEKLRHSGFLAGEAPLERAKRRTGSLAATTPERCIAPQPTIRANR